MSDVVLSCTLPYKETSDMAQRVITERVDDLDGSPAVETVRFGYAGRDYEIDLSEEHAAELDELLAPYIEHGRRANGAKPSRRARPAEGQRRRRSEEVRAIRKWAREQGLQVSDRGRVPADVIAKYDAARWGDTSP